jgi:hypothetical protein
LPDFHGTRPAEVCRDDQLIFDGGSFEDPTAAGHCLFRVQTEATVAGGCEDLHRAVQKIADEDRPVAPGCEPQYG